MYLYGTDKQSKKDNSDNSLKHIKKYSLFAYNEIKINFFL